VGGGMVWVLAAITSNQDQLQIRCAHQASHRSLNDGLHTRRQKLPTVRRRRLRSLECSSLGIYKLGQT